jgi:hypothetical protein
LGVEKHIACSDQLFMQLGVSEKTITREVCHLGYGAARARFFVGHDLQPFICRPQDAALHGDATDEVGQGLVQYPGDLDLPVDAIDVSTCVPEDLQDLVAEAHGLDARLPCRVHGFVKAPSRHL